MQTNGQSMRRVVYAKQQREPRNRAGGIPPTPEAISATLRQITSDPRRITEMVFNAATGRFHLSALPEQVTLEDKWDHLPEHNAPNDLHIAYVGTTGPFVVVRLDARLVTPKFFRMDEIKAGEPMPPMNTFISTVRQEKLPHNDVLPVVPNVNDYGRYRWLIGRKWFVQAGIIGGRGIQHVRVVEDLGILATNGTNSLYFLSLEQIYEAAEVNEPLPASREFWTEVFRGQGGAIGFMTPVYRLDDAEHVSLYYQSGVRHQVLLRMLRRTS